MIGQKSQTVHQKTRIAVLLGGESRERSISLRSGNAVYESLLRSGYRVKKIDTANGLMRNLKNNSFELAFPVLHGKGGEDGTIQRVLERLKIPYVGGGPKESFRSFNKIETKKIFIKNGIPTPKYQVVRRDNWKLRLAHWQVPFVLKPVDEGSSIGVSFIYDVKRSREIIKAAFSRYPVMLVEELIQGHEYTVGILGRKSLPVIEVRPKRAFYDFKAKYTKGMTKYLVPAPISKALSGKLRRLALQAHFALDLRDLSRVDFIVDKAGKIFVLEVNSIPGFTETSLLPKAAQCVGIGFDQLCIKLVQMAQIRQKRR